MEEADPYDAGQRAFLSDLMGDMAEEERRNIVSLPEFDSMLTLLKDTSFIAPESIEQLAAQLRSYYEASLAEIKELKV